MLRIRTLAPDDSIADLTSLLHRAYARLGAMGLNYTAVDQTPEVTAQRIAGGTCFVAEWAGRLAGTIVVKPTYTRNECAYFTRPGVAAVHQFAVDPSLQGSGIGRALLKAAEAWARDGGYRELAMDTAEPAAHLIAMYTRLGYAPVDVVQWTGKVYRSVVLSKALDPLDSAPAPAIEIVAFESEHCDSARALWERTPGVGLSDADEPDAIGRFLERNRGLSLVAVERGTVIGTILVGHDGRRGLIHHLAVARANRRRGIGRRLVGEAMRRLREAGIRKCHLLVFANNTDGRAFWTGVGAEHRDTLSVYSLGVA